MAAFGKVYMLAYAFGDRLHIHETWSQMAEQPELILKEQQYSLEESLHGREILAATSISLGESNRLVITGSEDTYLRVSNFGLSNGKLKVV